MTILAQNREQRQAIEHIHGPLLIIAGAGTGKTRVIVERVGFLLEQVPGLRPESILALTFGEKAAEEIQKRAVARFGEAAGRCSLSTFHAFCYRLLLKESPRRPPWRTLDEIDHSIFLRRNLESLDLDHYLHVSEPSRFLNDLLEFCSRCHDNLVSPAAYTEYVDRLAIVPATGGSGPGKKSKTDSRRRLQDDPEREIERQREVARVFARSEQLQESAGLLSFGAMMSRAIALLKNSPEILARQQRRYRFLMVDEFQDTNWAQIELLRLLAGESGNVAVVGDRKQAIYHFRGASHTSFDLFQQTFPGCKEVVLKENYRSTKRILSVAEAAIGFSPEERDRPERQKLETSNDFGVKAEVWEFVSEAEEAEFLAREIARQVRTNEARNFSDFAVLYRAHQNRNSLVRALRRHGVPFAIRKLSINNHPQVRNLITCLRAIGRPHDSVSLVRLIADARWQMPPELLLRLCRAASAKRIALRETIEAELARDSADPTTASAGAQALRRLADFLGSYQKIAREQRVAEWLHRVRDDLGILQGAEEESLWSAFSGFVRTWDSEKSSAGLLDEFLEYFGYFEEAGGVIALPDQDVEIPSGELAPEEAAGPAPALSIEPGQLSLFDPPAREAASHKVQLMTMHAAKGLEFENVILLHLVRGTFPSRRQPPLIEFPPALLRGPAPQGNVHREEERRLFYVALTRAQSRLTLCTVANEKQRPSVFLEELRDSRCPDLEWKKVPPCGAPEAAAIPIPEALTGAARSGDLVLSVSGLETYRECPLKYYFGQVCRIPILPSAALRFGSIMHGAVRQVVGGLARQPDQMPDAVLEAIFLENWTEAGFTDPVQERKYRAMGLEQLQGLRRVLSERPFDLLAQEKSFHFFHGGIQVAGRIDQLNRLGGNQVELIEYKTGRAQTQKDADQSLQLTVYALACREVLELEAVELVLYNLQTQERLRTRRAADDFRKLEESLRQTGGNILAGQFPASPGYHCRFCDFRSLCPALDDGG